MVHLTLPPGDYSIRPRGNQIEITSLDRELTREEVAEWLGRTERSIDLYRAFSGPAQLKAIRNGGRVVIMESELKRWKAYMDEHPEQYAFSNRSRKKRRARLDNIERPTGRALAENAA